MERFNLKELNDVERKVQYRVKISNRFFASENLDEMDINRAWETIREDTKILAKNSLVYYELKWHTCKPWFSEGCSKEQIKVQWLHDPNQINGDNLNNVRCKDSRNLRNKEM
jgi:hypothetical protein